MAIKNAIDYAEVDLRTTKDHQLIVMHDQTIDRMTDGKGKVRELTFAEISNLSVIDKGSRGLKYKVPLFSEVLDVCKNKIGIYLDFKDADVRATWELIREKGMEKNFVVYINTMEQFKDWRAIAPQVPLMVSLPDSVKSVNSLRSFLKIVDAEILDGDYTNYSPEMVKLALSNKRQVWLDFQQPGEGPKQWSIGIELGIQGFQTDKPRELKLWLSEQRK